MYYIYLRSLPPNSPFDTQSVQSRPWRPGCAWRWPASRGPARGRASRTCCSSRRGPGRPACESAGWPPGSTRSPRTDPGPRPASPCPCSRQAAPRRRPGGPGTSGAIPSRWRPPHVPVLGHVAGDGLAQQRDVKVSPLGRLALVLVQLHVHAAGQLGPVGVQAALPARRVAGEEPVLVAVRPEAVAALPLPLALAGTLRMKI